MFLDHTGDKFAPREKKAATKSRAINNPTAALARPGTPVFDVCNVALGEIGQRVRIGSFTDNSPAANAAHALHTPAKSRRSSALPTGGFAASPDYPDAVGSGTCQRAAKRIAGHLQPWLYSYLYPADCLRLRFVLPTLQTPVASPPLTTNASSPFCYPGVPTAIPFVEATDLDPDNNPIRVVLSNLTQAQAIYTRDLSQFPNLWDPLFHSAVTATLGAYFINALSRDKAQMQEQIAIAKNLLDTARVMNMPPRAASTTLTTFLIGCGYDARPAFHGCLSSISGPTGAMPGGSFDAMVFPDGLAY